MSTKIRVVIFKEGESWIAQALEHDICVQAQSLEDLYDFFEVAVEGEAAELGGLERIPQAPKYFFDLWDKRSSDANPAANANEAYSYGIAA
jgi:hypothetical protein